MLTTVEIPGLYVQPDQGLAFAFDQVEAEIVPGDPAVLSVKVSNPSPLPAIVRILVENSAAAALALPENAVLDAQVVELGPGESKILSFPISNQSESDGHGPISPSSVAGSSY